MELFDLTQPLGPDIPIEPGDPPFGLALASTHEAQGYQVTRVRLGSHTGTHVDAPRHFFAGGHTLDQYPLQRFAGRGVVLECRSTADAQTASLTEQLARYSLPARGSVLLWTEGAPLALESAKALLECNIGLVGTDAPSIDHEPYAVHQLLLACDVLIVENLRGLDRLGPGPVNCLFLPLALVGTDGAPVRAMAWRATEPQSLWW